MVDAEYQIKRVNGHYEVYVNDLFYCSVDTVPEATEEVEKLMYKVETNDER